MSYTLKCDDGDLFMESTGQYALVSGIEKCAQDIAESLLNNYDPDFATYYNGSELFLADANPKSVAAFGAEDFIRAAVEDCIRRLMDLQDADDYVENTEQIDKIAQLTVDRVGYMTYAFQLRCITVSEEEVPMNFTINLSQQLPAAISETIRTFVPAGQDSGSSPYL